MKNIFSKLRKVTLLLLAMTFLVGCEAISKKIMESSREDTKNTFTPEAYEKVINETLAHVFGEGNFEVDNNSLVKKIKENEEGWNVYMIIDGKCKAIHNDKNIICKLHIEKSFSIHDEETPKNFTYEKLDEYVIENLNNGKIIWCKRYDRFPDEAKEKVYVKITNKDKEKIRKIIKDEWDYSNSTSSVGAKSCKVKIIKINGIDETKAAAYYELTSKYNGNEKTVELRAEVYVDNKGNWHIETLAE